MVGSAAETAKLGRQGRERDASPRILLDALPADITLQETRPGASRLAELACILEPEDEDVSGKVNSAKGLYLEGQGPIPVAYGQPEYETSKGHHAFGRFYARQQSLQRVNKKVRSLASGGKMDFAASHQTLACELFPDHDDLKPLKEYVNDKANCVNAVAQWAGCTEEDAKENFFQRLSFGGSLQQGCNEVEAKTGAPIGRNYPRFLKRFADATKKLPRKLEAKFPEAFGFAKSISEEVKDKPEALKPGSAMALFLQHVEAEVAWLAITIVHEPRIEVSAFIHDGLLVHCEDADAISIEEFEADLRERLGFRWLTLKWKPLEVTEDVQAWRDDLLSRHSRIDSPALHVAERIRSVLAERAKWTLNTMEIARTKATCAVSAMRLNLVPGLRQLLHWSYYRRVIQNPGRWCFLR